MVFMNFSTDVTQSGHTLGRPELRTTSPAPERCLSPQAMCIMRAIMHSALVWCTCRCGSLSNLISLVKPSDIVNSKTLSKFFWNHLKKDIENLSRAIGKGMSESALIVHTVLHDILIKPPSECKNDIQLERGKMR